MKTLAMATLIAAVITPAYAQETGYDNAESFITEYKDGSQRRNRWLYIRGVGEGLVLVQLVCGYKSGKPAFCGTRQAWPRSDGQYVAMMRQFLIKYPTTKTMPPPSWRCSA